jgi:hypothetical protein
MVSEDNQLNSSPFFMEWREACNFFAEALLTRPPGPSPWILLLPQQ